MTTWQVWQHDRFALLLQSGPQRSLRTEMLQSLKCQITWNVLCRLNIKARVKSCKPLCPCSTAWVCGDSGLSTTSSKQLAPVLTVVGRAGPQPQTHALPRYWTGGRIFLDCGLAWQSNGCVSWAFIQEQTNINQHLLPVSTVLLDHAEGWASPSESFLTVVLCACSLHAWVRNTWRDSLHLTDSHKTNCQQTF